jgi:hypothetical protein
MPQYVTAPFEYFPLYYLMYTTNQRADFFASDDDWGDVNDYPLWGGWIGDWSFIPPEIAYFQTKGSITEYGSLIIASEYTLPYCVRAMATLYQIFGKRVGDPTMNAPPVVGTLEGGSVKENAVYSEDGFFTDPDSGYRPPLPHWTPADAWTATVDYGNGSGPKALVLETDGTFALRHEYSEKGIYKVTVTVTDNTGKVGSNTAQVTVIEDCEGDFNEDSKVDGLDFIMLRNEWGMTDCLTNSCGCDMNEDGKVDGLDFIIFRNNWGEVCPL